MGKLRSLYMRPAVQLKRILKGNFGQTKYTGYLEKHEHDSPEILQRLQAEKLCLLMKHACSRIPYYMPLKDSLGLTPETAFEDKVYNSFFNIMCDGYSKQSTNSDRSDARLVGLMIRIGMAWIACPPQCYGRRA